QERMPSALQLQVAAIVHAGQRRLPLMSKPRLGEGKIQLPKQSQVDSQVLCNFCNPRGQLLQHLLDLPLFADAELAKPIVHLYDRLWLDEQGSARARLIVDDAAKMAAILLLHRYHVTVA